MEFIKKIYYKYENIINYLIVGGLTTVISMTIYFVSVNTFLNPNNGIQLQIANILSWIGGVLFAYFTNRKFVFKSEEQNKLKEGCKFLLSRVITLLLDMLVMYIGVTALNVNDKIVKIISQIIITISNYIFSKMLVFKNNKI